MSQKPKSKLKKAKTLKELYNAMNGDQKKKFLEDVEENCECHFTTAYRWISGSTKPRAAEKKIIATMLKLKTAEILF